MNSAYKGSLVSQDAWAHLSDSCIVGYEISFHNQMPESCLLQSEIKAWVQQQFDEGLFNIEYSVEVQGAFEYERTKLYQQMGWTEE